MMTARFSCRCDGGTSNLVGFSFLGIQPFAGPNAASHRWFRCFGTPHPWYAMYILLSIALAILSISKKSVHYLWEWRASP